MGAKGKMTVASVVSSPEGEHTAEAAVRAEGLQQYVRQRRTNYRSNRTGTIIAVSSSAAKGEKKRPTASGMLQADHGLAGDAHAGSGRQVSLLAQESIDEIRRLGLEVSPGDFAENLTTEGLVLHTLPVGTRLLVGPEAILEITQIGKDCHARCAIFEQVGTCVMPTQGVFAKVLRGGEVKAGDSIEVASDD